MPETSDSLIPLPAQRLARVAVDMSLPHLDRFFDYEVPDSLTEKAIAGARVRVKFGGRLLDGFIVDVRDEDDPADKPAPLEKVVSVEPVLTAEIVELIRAVADHYGGCFADTMRLAVPPRHARTEKTDPGDPRPVTATPDAGPWAAYPTGEAFLRAIAAGQRPRAMWQLAPTASPAGDWATGLAVAAAHTATGGRGSVLVVPDHRDLTRLEEACTEVLGAGRFAVLTAEAGPAARYRNFLAVLRGKVQVVIGTRAAAFAPMPDLGLVAMFDDGDDLHAEPRAPYPHVREVLAIRARQSSAAMVVAGYSRTCEVQQLIDHGWMSPLAMDQPMLRRSSPAVRISADSDRALERDPLARSVRVPGEAFKVIRAGLAAGPVLLQVPRAGYLVSLVCDNCRTPARCARCTGPLSLGQPPAEGADGAPAQAERGIAHCRWCNAIAAGWRCGECGGRRWRAPVVGAARTAEEIGRAFPQTTIKQSRAGQVLDSVEDAPALVIATPGAEPRATGGYAAAVLLDTELLLMRTDLRVAEEALRRWLNAAALVRPGAAGGTVFAVGDSGSRPLQALVRLDPAGHAWRELAERAEAHLPPAARMITVEGPQQALTQLIEHARLDDTGDGSGPVELLGPVELPPAPHSETVLSRLTVRSPLRGSAEVVRAIKQGAGVRTARKEAGAIRIRVDPQVID